MSDAERKTFTDEEALAFHRHPQPGKLEVTPTKPMATQRDLALAYSPGVAYACTAIVDDAANAAKYTARANLVAVISNGTAVLGLGAIGPLAAVRRADHPFIQAYFAAHDPQGENHGK